MQNVSMHSYKADLQFPEAQPGLQGSLLVTEDMRAKKRRKEKKLFNKIHCFEHKNQCQRNNSECKDKEGITHEVGLFDLE